MKADMRNFGPWEIREHPVLLRVDAYMHDQSGTQSLDGDGNPVMWKTTGGDVKWNLEWQSLESENRRILDNLNFSPGGQKRVWILYTRAGLAKGDEMEEMDLEPDDLDGSKWWVKPEHQVRPAKGTFAGNKEGQVDNARLTKTTLRDYMRAGKIAESAYQYKAKCQCNVCQACDGEMVNVDSRVGFEAFRLMKPMEAAKFTPQLVAGSNGAGANEDEDDESLGSKSTLAVKLCGACVKGDHVHSYKKNDCECEDPVHPDF